jgi:RHS repeat-associated protein
MNAGFISFQYDPHGRRVAKTVAGITTNYLFDKANVVQELSGGSVIANLLTGSISEIFTRTDSSGTGNFLTNALGSPLTLVNSSGSNLVQYVYEPFGNTSVASGSSTDEFQYDGEQNDGDGLYYFRARYYSPVMQRFISEDPTLLRSGDVNFYTYGSNNPVRHKDPYGTDDLNEYINLNTAIGGVVGAFFNMIDAYIRGTSIAHAAITGGVLGAFGALPGENVPFTLVYGVIGGVTQNFFNNVDAGKPAFGGAVGGGGCGAVGAGAGLINPVVGGAVGTICGYATDPPPVE